MMVKIEAREYRLEMMIQELEDLNQTIKKNTINVVSAMAHALAARDTYTEGHTARVADLAKRMADTWDLMPIRRNMYVWQAFCTT